MSKGFDPIHGYNSHVNYNDVTGYGMPPKAHRLSKLNQPNYMPAALPPRRKVTPLELETRMIEVSYSNGRTGMKRADALAREKLVERAMKSDMRSAEDLYAQLDWEADTWMEKPRYKKSRHSDKHAGEQIVAALVGLFARERRHLEQLGVIARIEDNEYCIMPWVNDAYARYQDQALVQPFVREAVTPR